MGKDGKAKSDASVLKAKSTTTTTVRQPLKHVAGLPTAATTTRRTTKILVARENTVVPEIRHEDIVDHDAMAVDDGHPSRASLHIPAPIPETRHISHLVPVVSDDEEERATKRPRTSSDAPEEVDAIDKQLLAVDDASPEADVFEPEEEVEADPDGDQWDDLDAEDHDDPIMVSEYVNEIFEYMKTIEVR